MIVLTDHSTNTNKHGVTHGSKLLFMKQMPKSQPKISMLFTVMSSKEVMFCGGFICLSIYLSLFMSNPKPIKASL